MAAVGMAPVAGLMGLGELQLRLPASKTQWFALMAGLALGLLGLVLAWHHPLSGPLALTAWGACALAAAVFWVKTPVLLLAPLPLIGLAPWSGWITFEEQDLLVTACGCGGYLAYALQLNARDRAPAWRHGLVYSTATVVLVGALALSLLWSVKRGFADAGGFHFGWFHGYHEAMNSVRNAKALFLVLALLPLWTAAAAARPRGFSRGLLLGLVLALAGGSASALWERLAYTGLLDFSTDYRTTALFWEMHVGGAALDGFLVMTLPFALLALLRTRSPWRFAIGLGIALLAAYAVLTTFSRGVYLALPLGLVPMVLLADAQRRRAAASGAESSHIDSTLGPVDEPLPRLAKLGALAMAGAFGLAAMLVFGGGGYRGLLALFFVMIILLTMPASLWRPSLGQRIMAVLMGGVLALLLGGASWALSMAVPKAAYVLNAVALMCCAALRWRDEPTQTRPVYVLLVTTCWFWLLATMVIVADYWGGTAGRWTSLAAGLALGGLWAAMLVEPRLWPLQGAGHRGKAGWRKRALLVTGLLLVLSVVAALGGGGYLRDRLASWKEDGQTRLTHWHESLRLLHGGRQWLFGKGTGRFVSSNLYEGPLSSRAGDYRLRTDEGEAYLALTAGQHMLGSGEQFRVSQRIAAPSPGPVTLTLVSRTASDAQIVLQICEKNLIYPADCIGTEQLLKPLRQEGSPTGSPPGWETRQVQLGNAPAMGGDWWAPRFVTFSMALDTQGARVDIARVAVQDAQGHALLVNGDFNREMARWFFSSDRHHLPWHIKNVALHVLFEQGLLGLALMGSIYVLALARLSFGRGRDHPLAPAIFAALIGFGTVGAFDSQLDAARIGFLFFTLLLLGLGLRALPGEGVARVA
ncbi:hypothetical protein [Pelomonas cellulosilytica]|uniref:Uncharacterized protein n=1 Tax=Pelomonas cellulosilytica TaxID=2906762 RepID=A0ABS8XSM1_9BURK|nr:hypothetical protein [Pelomonas sp. P8]MCE4554178.1 hypothetical protein [Pelomonas sp. P8]